MVILIVFAGTPCLCSVLALLWPIGFRSISKAEMADFGISAGQSVAVVWDKSSPVEALKDLVDKLQTLTGDEGQVSVENINQLLQCKYLPTLSLQGCGG